MILPPRPTRQRTETNTVADIRIALNATPGVRVFRNNTGALKDDDGRVVTFGLADGSADLVGIAWGKFLAIEVKKSQPRWMASKRAKPSKHEQSQLDWIALVEEFGGVGGIAWDVPSAMAILERAKLLPVLRG